MSSSSSSASASASQLLLLSFYLYTKVSCITFLLYCMRFFISLLHTFQLFFFWIEECLSFMIYLSLIDWITNASKTHLTSLAPLKKSFSFLLETIFFRLFSSFLPFSILYDAINKSYHVSRWIMSESRLLFVRVCDGYEWLCLRYKQFLLCFVTRDMDLHLTYSLSFYLFILCKEKFLRRQFLKTIAYTAMV